MTSAPPTPPPSPSPTSRVPGAAFTRGFLGEFRAFLDNYGVIGLAIAFIIGAALTNLVQAVVKDILMPLINPLFAVFGSDWRTSQAYVGTVGPFLWGDFLYNLIYFLIIALFVFAIAKWLLRQKEIKKI